MSGNQVNDETTEDVIGPEVADSEEKAQEPPQPKVQLSGAELRSRLEDILATLSKADASDNELTQAVSDLCSQLWGNSMEPRFTFVRELKGLDTLLGVIGRTEDKELLSKVANAVDAIANGRCDLEDDCVAAGAVKGLTTLLKYPSEPGVKVRSDAASALGSILCTSLNGRREVINLGTLDALEDLLERDGEENFYAVFSVFNMFREMGEEVSIQLTERFGKRIMEIMNSDDTPERTVDFGCGFLANTLFNASYRVAVSSGILDTLQNLLRKRKSSKGSITTPMRGLKLIPRHYDDTSLIETAIEKGLVQDFLDALPSDEEEDCTLALAGLASFARSGICWSEFEKRDVYGAVKTVSLEWLPGNVFFNCLKFLEAVVESDPPPSSLEHPQFLDLKTSLLEKAATLIGDTSSPDMQEMALYGVVDSLCVSEIRSTFLLSGAVPAIMRVLNALNARSDSSEEEGDSLELRTLQCLINFLLDEEARESLVKEGVVSVLFKSVARTSSRVWLFRCLGYILYESEAAREETPSADCFKTLVPGLLDDDDQQVVASGELLVMAGAKNTSAHAQLVESGVCPKLLDLATSSAPENVEVCRRAFIALKGLVNQDDYDQDEPRKTAARAILDARTFQRFEDSIFSAQAPPGPTIRPAFALELIMVLFRSQEVELPDVGASLIRAIIDHLGRTANPAEWYYALSALTTIAEVTEGLEMIFDADPSLMFLKPVFESEALQSDSFVLQCLATSVQSSWTSDVSRIPTMIENGYLSDWVKLLKGSHPIARIAASQPMIGILFSGADGRKAAVDAGVMLGITTLLTSGDALQTPQALEMSRVWASEQEGNIALEAGLHDHIMTLLRSSQSHQIKRKAFGCVNTYWDANKACRDTLLDRGLVAAIKTQLASEVASTGARKGLDQTDVEKTQGLAANVADGVEAEANIADEEPKDDEAADDQGPGDGEDNVQDEDEQDEDRLTCSRVALSLLADMLSAEEARSRLTSDGIFPVLGSLLQHNDSDIARAALRATYQTAAEGTTDMRKAILDSELESLVKLHAHREYSAHAEAEECIREIASDPALLPDLVQRLADFLQSEGSDEAQLSSTLLVIDDLVGTAEEADFAANVAEMRKVGLPGKIKEMIGHSSGLVKSRAEQVHIDWEKRCSSGAV